MAKRVLVRKAPTRRQRKLLAKTQEPTELALLTRAERALVEARDAIQIQKVIDWAEAARVIAREARLGTAMVNHANEIKVLAERKLAEVVREGREAGTIAGQGTNVKNTPPTPGGVKPATLEDLGISQQRFSEAKLFGEFEPGELRQMFDRASAQDQMVSRKQLLEEARGRARRVIIERVNGHQVTVAPVTVDEAEDMVAAAGLTSVMPLGVFQGDYQTPRESSKGGIKAFNRLDGTKEIVLALARSEWQEFVRIVVEHKKRADLPNTSQATLDLIRLAAPPTLDEVIGRFRVWLATTGGDVGTDREALAWKAFAAGAGLRIAGEQEASKDS